MLWGRLGGFEDGGIGERRICQRAAHPTKREWISGPNGLGCRRDGAYLRMFIPA
jgi:hypothetical protein